MKKKLTRPPVILQMETLECGAACLAMILAYYGKWVPMEQLRIDCGVSRDGSNAKNMLRAARHHGMEAKGFRLEPEELSGLPFPCIVFWEDNHFMVVNGIRGKHVYVNDPAGGAQRMGWDEFKRGFSGVALTLSPTEEFKPGGSRQGIFKYLITQLKGMKRAVIFVVLTAVLGYIFDMVNPAMTRVFLDNLLTGDQPGWVGPFFLLLIIFTLLNIIVGWIEAIYTLRIHGKMAVMGSIRYMWHLFRLPMSFFSQRMTGDLIDRHEMNERISETLVHSVAPLFLDSVMMVVYLLMMVRYHVYLSIVGIVSILIHALMARIISTQRINITRVEMRDEGRLHSYTMSGIHMMETIKSCGAENGFFEKWSGCQAAVYASRSRYIKNDTYLGIIPALISEIAGDLILIAGVWLVLHGEFEIGMILAFQQILQLFLRPAVSAIESGKTIREMTMQVERVNDVMRYPREPGIDGEAAGTAGGTVGAGAAGGTAAATETAGRTATGGAASTAGSAAGATATAGRAAEEEAVEAATEEFEKLRGEIEIKDLVFGYAPLGEPLITDFSMHVKPGSRVAIVGESGCGKSTIASLLSGLYKPWKGEILFDGKPIDTINRQVFTGSLAVVDQDIILFEDTIANNIKMWDDTIEDFEMILAARDAGMYDEIIKRADGYEGKILEGGKNFSGGERQRLEIARVLAKDPSIIILDEATSALDAETEAEVVKRICDRGITCIVIAHRLTTVKDCDEIIVLDHGQITERGTHDELLKMNGLYSELVTDELV